jgi:MYXO-CTERM domain-containing protein
MSCQNVSPFGKVCYYDDDPPGVVGSTCAENTDCGSYICEDSACVTECNLATGDLCPDGFQCSTLDDENYYCHSTRGSGGGGCSAAGGGRGAAALALVLLGLGATLRRRRGRAA